MVSIIASNLHRIKARINALGGERVQLIAVTKNRSAAEVEELWDAGQRLFGENRIQEAELKYSRLRVARSELRLHLIGALQRNKVNVVDSALFDCIQSLDRPELAERLALFQKRGATIPPLFIQVNIGNEPQKNGVAPQRAEELLRLASGQLKLPVVGLMAIPPPHNSGDYFAPLKQLQLKLGLAELSMGMSDDYEQAVKAGASYVRVGRGLFT